MNGKRWLVGCAPYAVPFLRQAVRWIARLGGFLVRKGDGEPGVKTLRERG
jgi:Transposase Tn5 dimerisation domain